MSGMMVKAGTNAMRNGQGSLWSCRCNAMLTGRVMTRQMRLGKTIHLVVHQTQCFVGYDGEYLKEG